MACLYKVLPACSEITSRSYCKHHLPLECARLGVDARPSRLPCESARLSRRALKLPITHVFSRFEICFLLLPISGRAVRACPERNRGPAVHRPIKKPLQRRPLPEISDLKFQFFRSDRMASSTWE